MDLTPVLEPEEYVEQAYFFRAFREAVALGDTAQEVLERVSDELLSTTRLPMAVQFMLAELKHSGQMATALNRLTHYFTPFQAFVIGRSEEENAKFSSEQALLILEREAEYRSKNAGPAGLFIYQFEVISRNRLGYHAGLTSMENDAFYSDDWRQFIRLVRGHLGDREIAELIFARSSHFVRLRQQADRDYVPTFAQLFEEKEGRIAKASIGKDPAHLFAALHRQLGYPEVPRPPKRIEEEDSWQQLQLRLERIETKLTLMEAEVTGKADLSKIMIPKEEHELKPSAPNDLPTPEE